MPEALPVPLLSAAPEPPRRGRLTVEIRQHATGWHQGLVLAGGLALGMALATAILLACGVGLSDLIQEFVVSVVSSPASLSAVLIQAAPLAIVGLAAAVAFRVRFWNIGIEGQMILGAVAATAVAIHDVGPAPLRLVLMMLVAALAGMAWVLAPALLKIRLGLNEVISTLLLNYVAFNGLLHLLYGAWRDPASSFPNSEQYEAAERLGELGWENLTWALPLAGLLTVLCWWLLNVSRFGFLSRVAEANPRLGEGQGLPMTRVMLAAALLSGGLAGIAGFSICAGVEYRMTQSFFSGYGFSGILIAFLARNNPLGAFVTAILVGVLFVAGQSLQVFYGIPGAMVQLIQAVIVISVAASDFFVRHRVRWVSGRRSDV
ncbi:ABC transporter permease [Methylobacterium sp. J-078]|uniref:ABC transporter permease n=1 Tax=Methylobacterium sp. J-078 TaxID=2836657 RepID=UPI001FBBE898|nr:ABC transporter permease [Methylobacterium sp. J-078]MCJ2043880.1 ABC transporter permease [Methylobacterium sp. J-078]